MIASNSDPGLIALGISQRIEEVCTEKDYERIVLVGYSLGALLTRKAYLIGQGRAKEVKGAYKASWAEKVRRIILLAGMNRGVDLTGLRPSDELLGTYLSNWGLAKIANGLNVGQLRLQMERGSPFVANLRLQWMRLSHDLGERMPATVQLLGDIDDLVRDEDNKDLRVAGTSRFAWLKVRGTGHDDICKVNPDEPGLSDADKYLC